MCAACEGRKGSGLASLRDRAEHHGRFRVSRPASPSLPAARAQRRLLLAAPWLLGARNRVGEGGGRPGAAGAAAPTVGFGPAASMAR
jgi:hypothetical protein